jgi:hypothetical protein
MAPSNGCLAHSSTFLPQRQVSAAPVRAYLPRRIVWALIGAIAIATLVVSVANLCRSRKEFDPQAYQRIAKGMSLDEVQDLLGGPPGDYGSCRNGVTVDLGHCNRDVFRRDYIDRKTQFKEWLFEVGGIRVFFSKDGKVLGKQTVFVHRPWLSLWEQIISRLK